MFSFQVLKKSKKSRARLGLLKTSRGEVVTPALVPVATQASVKALTNEQILKTGSRILIANTLHLHLKPGEKIVAASGGLHRFMNWSRPLMTDSGGFQVFSLGFGRDYRVGKILKEPLLRRGFPLRQGFGGQVDGLKIIKRQQPKLLKITDDGVLFTSYLDGRQIFLGPKESMKIQSDLGADIIFVFDECAPPAATLAYTRESLARTHKWAKICLANKNNRQALYGIVQGGKFKNLRQESARVIGKMNFDGFGIGGEFGDSKDAMSKMLRAVNAILPEEKPRHLLGIGHPEDIVHIIKEGADTFDCTAPTHYARHGMAFTSAGRLELSQSKYLKDKSPLDKKCECFVCLDHSRAYLSHLVRSKEMTAATLLTFHNLFYFHQLVAETRQKIKNGTL